MLNPCSVLPDIDEGIARTTFGGDDGRPVDVKNEYDPVNVSRLNATIGPTDP